ncbi:39S ribosomal protein L54, mitochondrial [Suncus etruscus]|uniref:39S ribosomal protein L54, mitochondrial n=1 Tax=Suncus etruscus TaxID=109475 RepID=UPI00210FABC1|nr:39S ribosomal protein L54, mitochondrial [Suncus etruscus]
MAARRLFGVAGRLWLGCWPRELPEPADPRRLVARGYAKRPVMKGAKGGKGSAPIQDLKDPDVCKDPVLLTTHAMGVNIYKGGEDVPLKPDSEYPEWLFQMNLGPPKTLEELDPESREYWRLLRKQNIWRNNRLSKGQKF